MSDVDPTLDPGTEPPVVDEEFAALLERLMPFMIDSAKAAVTEAAHTTPTTTYRPGAVVGVDAALRTVSVLCDGDTAAITAQVLTELPGMNDRVFVEFRAGGAVVVTGFITECGEQAGFVKAYAGSVAQHAGGVSGSATPGEPPRGWLWCAGQAVSRSTYPALYRAIGDTWGAGDGSTTFNVPDFRGRIPVGLDNMGGSDAGRISASNTLGGTGGTETHTLATSNLPSHDHGLNSHTHTLSGGTVSGTTGTDSPNHTHQVSNVYNGAGLYTSGPNGGGAGNTINNVTTVTSSGVSTNHTHSFSGSLSGGSVGAASGNTGTTGSGSSVNHLQPYALVHYLIKS